MGRKRKPEGEAKTTIFVSIRKRVYDALESHGNAGKSASNILEKWYENETKKEKN